MVTFADGRPACPQYRAAPGIRKAGVREGDMCHQAEMKDADLAAAGAGEPRLCHVAQIDDMRMPAISKCLGVKECGHVELCHMAGGSRGSCRWKRWAM